MTDAKQNIKERPILFSGEMVRAILDGRKTQTRRVVKADWLDEAWTFLLMDEQSAIFETDVDWNPRGKAQNSIKCPYGKPGERLWVREACWIHREYKKGLNDHLIKSGENVFYCADYDWTQKGFVREHYKKRPSIHMPRAASRILLEVTDVRVERLNDISEADAIAEGILQNHNDEFLHPFWHYAGEGCWGAFSARHSFDSLWRSIKGPGSLEQNPWVWVVEFKKI